MPHCLFRMAAHDEVPGTCYQVSVSTGFTPPQRKKREALLEGKSTH